MTVAVAGINVKILDQPKAVEGILQFLAYRRTDGRVRRSEAIQAITLHLRTARHFKHPC